METKLKSYKFLKTIQGSKDGINVETFNKGETHELPENLAEQFYHLAAIDEVTGKGKKSPVEENKALETPENKSGEPGPILHPGQDEGAEGVGVDFKPDGQTAEETAQEEAITGEKSPSKKKK